MPAWSPHASPRPDPPARRAHRIEEQQQALQTERVRKMLGLRTARRPGPGLRLQTLRWFAESRTLP